MNKWTHTWVSFTAFHVSNPPRKWLDSTQGIRAKNVSVNQMYILVFENSHVLYILILYSTPLPPRNWSMLGSIRNFKLPAWFYFFYTALDEKVNNGIVQHSTQVVIICVKIYKLPETWVVIRYSKCVYTKYMTIFKIT